MVMLLFTDLMYCIVSSFTCQKGGETTILRNCVSLNVCDYCCIIAPYVFGHCLLSEAYFVPTTFRGFDLPPKPRDIKFASDN